MGNEDEGEEEGENVLYSCLCCLIFPKVSGLLNALLVLLFMRLVLLLFSLSSLVLLHVSRNVELICAGSFRFHSRITIFTGFSVVQLTVRPKGSLGAKKRGTQ